MGVGVGGCYGNPGWGVQIGDAGRRSENYSFEWMMALASVLWGSPINPDTRVSSDDWQEREREKEITVRRCACLSRWVRDRMRLITGSESFRERRRETYNSVRQISSCERRTEQRRRVWETSVVTDWPSGDLKCCYIYPSETTLDNTHTIVQTQTVPYLIWSHSHKYRQTRWLSSCHVFYKDLPWHPPKPTSIKFNTFEFCLIICPTWAVVRDINDTLNYADPFLELIYYSIHLHWFD